MKPKLIVAYMKATSILPNKGQGYVREQVERIRLEMAEQAKNDGKVPDPEHTNIVTTVIDGGKQLKVDFHMPLLQGSINTLQQRITA